MISRKIIAPFLLVILLATPTWAGLDNALTAYERGDYAEALCELRRLARLGYQPAQYNLGVMHYRGNGVPQNNLQAYGWINLAASQGYGPAINKRHMVGSELTPEQISEAQSLVRRWWVLNR